MWVEISENGKDLLKDAATFGEGDVLYVINNL